MNFLWRLGLRNLLRNRSRTLITVMAIVVGVAGLILSGGFVRDIFVQLGEALIHSQSGHAQIGRTAIFTFGTRSPEAHLLLGHEELRQQLLADPGVQDVMARLTFSGILNNGKTDYAIVAEGIEADRESLLGTHMRIVSGRMLRDDDRFGAMLGEGLARTLNLKPGDAATIVVSTLDGATNTLDVEVTGVFRTFSKDFDAHAARISLAAAQELLNTSAVARLVVSLKDTGSTDSFLARTGTLLPEDVTVIGWRTLNDFYDKTVELYDKQFGFLRVMVLLMVCLSVVNTINMGLLERSWEFGTMQALGNRHSQIAALIVMESLILGSLGVLAGILVGVSLAGVISGFGIPMPPPPNSEAGYNAYIRIVPGVIAESGAVGFLATITAAAYPAFRMSRIPIIDALRARA